MLIILYNCEIILNNYKTKLNTYSHNDNLKMSFFFV